MTIIPGILDWLLVAEGKPGPAYDEAVKAVQDENRTMSPERRAKVEARLALIRKAVEFNEP